MSIIQSLFPVEVGRLRAELDIPDLATNPATVINLLFEFESSTLGLKDIGDVVCHLDANRDNHGV